MKVTRLLLISTLLLSAQLYAQEPTPLNTQNPLPALTFEQQVAISSELVAVVSESSLEPRSLGSYTVKIYAVVKPERNLDRFITGLVVPRDGTIESIKTVDINLDGDKELVVIMRSVGSGNYLSADVFDISRAGLKLLANVSGLASNANPVSALTEKIRDQKQ